MRHVALLWMVAVCAGATLATPAAYATCSQPPCVDAEPMWLPPASRQFSLVSDTSALPAAQLAASLSLLLRWRPAALNVPAPSQNGRDVNLLAYAMDAALGLRLGLGQRLELTMVTPVGLYQRGSGIKGVTDQSAEEVPAQSVHDPRLGFGYAFDTHSASFGAKLRFEAKLPLGNGGALSGETSAVGSPSLALSARHGGFRAGLELGARLRRPVDFYGARVGSQGTLALGLGYELPHPRLGLTLEGYLAPSLVAGSFRYLPAEWLATARWTPAAWKSFFVGLAGGGGLPLSDSPSGAVSGIGVPAFRTLLFAGYAPGQP
ncbi:MAG TPA: hypothetical protein VHB79_13995 [Polyangiaceae bacterium]|nr:hypothetical protein [Polyangiaceae bacterium]